MNKKIFVSLVIAALCGALIVTNIDAAPKAKIVLKKYPDFKIGILANNFVKPLPLTKDNMKKVMDWTSENGFA